MHPARLALTAFGLVSLTACTTAFETADAQAEIVLFDGETLNGWKPTEENPESFKVKDGAIVTDGPRAHLFYDGEGAEAFADFELSLKVKTTPGSNSGVFVHSKYQTEGWPSHGVEAQVNATQGDFRKTGSVYAIADIRVYESDVIAPTLGFDSNAYTTRSAPPHVDNEWFDYLIRVEDGTISTSVNGELLVKWTQPEGWPDTERRLGSGTIALQAHDPDSIVYYKDIILRPID
ncbi:MAG: DUF1080 domain-containing protein [Henriciella sp.]|nr:DUF1080 domain-containing protein [Henriciella sp.]